MTLYKGEIWVHVNKMSPGKAMTGGENNANFLRLHDWAVRKR